jgi:sugar/nucleoside kinase (ribokinase family)
VRLLGVVGLVSLDRVDGGLPRLGGAPFYAAQALRLLGHPARLVTKLAPEDSGRGLHALGIPTAVGRATKTISFRIENDSDGSRRLELEEPGDPWTTEDAEGWVARELIGADWVHAGALTQADFPAETLAVLARGRTLSFDGQGLVRSSSLGPVELDGAYDPAVLRHVGVLKLSQEEADALGIRLDDRSLGSLGVREIVVTLGGKGCVVYADGLAEFVPTRPVDVADPTGAGDQFMAAYLAYRRGGHSPISAARLAGALVAQLLARRRNFVFHTHKVGSSLS